VIRFNRENPRLSEARAGNALQHRDVSERSSKKNDWKIYTEKNNCFGSVTFAVEINQLKQ